MKSYKIVRLDGLHYDILKSKFCEKNKEQESQSYEEQLKNLFMKKYFYSDSFSRTMKTLGHNAHEIVYDSEILQKTWAKEKGIKFDINNWQHDIVLKQIDYLRPDILYFQDIGSLPHSIRKNLKEHFPFIKLIVIYKGAPGTSLDSLRQLSDADVLLACSPVLVDKFNEIGLKSHLIYHFFDNSVLDILRNPLTVESTKYDFTFVGMSGFGKGIIHHARYWAIVELIQKTNLNAWVYERKKKAKISHTAKLKAPFRKLLKSVLWSSKIPTLRTILNLKFLPDKLKRITQETIRQKQSGSKEVSRRTIWHEPRFPKKPLLERFPARCHPPVFGMDMYKVLYNSKMTFNKHTEEARNTVDTMRVFEATGVGTCLLTDTGRNMKDLFEEDCEVVTYSSIDECIEKVNYLLEHDDVRQQIAEAGQKRTLKDHTVINRCRQIDEILQKML